VQHHVQQPQSLGCLASEEGLVHTSLDLLAGELVQPLHNLGRDDLPELFLSSLALKLAR
jgi:hypothetical protein